MRVLAAFSLAILGTGLLYAQECNLQRWRMNPLKSEERCGDVSLPPECPAWIASWGIRSVRAIGLEPDQETVQDAYAEDLLDEALRSAACWYEVNGFLTCGEDACLFPFLSSESDGCLYVAIAYPRLLDRYHHLAKETDHWPPSSPFSFSVQFLLGTDGLEWLGTGYPGPPDVAPQCRYTGRDDAVRDRQALHPE